MDAVKSDLQKLENLLNSATNARQRKMYQSLLEKALKDIEEQKSASESETKTNVPAQITSSTKNKQQRHKTAKITISPDPTEFKDENKLIKEPQTSKEANKSPDIQTEEASNQHDKKQSQTEDSFFFQAIGLIKCTPKIRENKLFITVDGQEYDLIRGHWGARRHFDKLKRDIERNGPQEKLLRVYPKILHNQREKQIKIWFSLNKIISGKSTDNFLQEDFIFRGIWQKVSHCSEPVISIFRNLEMLEMFRRTSTYAAKKAFARPQDFPMVWNSPVEQYQYDPKLEQHKQMPRYFVQVKAVFKDGEFRVTEMLAEPTLDIPKFIKFAKKKVRT